MAESLTSKPQQWSLLGTCGVRKQAKEKSLNETMRLTLVDIVKPINDIKKGKGDGEKHSGPLVYGVHVS